MQAVNKELLKNLRERKPESSPEIVAVDYFLQIDSGEGSSVEVLRRFLVWWCGATEAEFRAKWETLDKCDACGEPATNIVRDMTKDGRVDVFTYCKKHARKARLIGA